MKYFLPDWEDRVDPNFDYEDDFGFRRASDPYTGRVYAHEIFETPPYDGILISLAVFEGKVRLDGSGDQPFLRGKTDIKEYLRIAKSSKRLLVMADCGAFTYVNEEIPPVRPSSVADLYNDLGFDLGISPDHIVVNSIVIQNGDKVETHQLSVVEKEERRRISLRNAEKFFLYTKKHSLCFTPMGSAQGYDTKTYLDSLNKLIDMEYQHIAVGGLARLRTSQVEEMVRAIASQIQKREAKINLHLLGVLRPNLLPLFSSLGISSFDSASFLRKAWLRSGMNYLGVNGQWYAAIRIPFSFDPRVKAEAERKRIGQQRLERLEREALQAIIDLERKRLSVNKTLEAVIEYDSLLERVSSSEHDIAERYKKTLRSRIWEQCSCPVCRDAGIHIVVFRGANRNKRRGFHNTKMFYDLHLNGV
jgi:queuine/archaeosine tRNA-ribosyltransferase